MKPKLRSAYDDHEVVSEQNGIDCSKNDPQQTVQHAQQNFKDDCDINILVKKFGVGGVPRHTRIPLAGDFTGLNTYQEAMNATIAAQQAFDDLPAELRERFGNDPARMIAFVSNDANRDEAIRLGMIDKPPAPPAGTVVVPTAEPPKP